MTLNRQPALNLKSFQFLKPPGNLEFTRIVIYRPDGMKG